MSASYRLFHYWRSTSSWRVRWALALKGITPEFVHVNLLDGESESAAHRARNPFGYVPVLELLNPPAGKNRYLTESIAILEYLEETISTTPLLPKDPVDRAHIRALVESVNAGTQPLQNLSTQIYFSPDSDPQHPDKRRLWAQHWIRNGMNAYETLIRGSAGKFSFGDSVTMADLCLIPQCYAAERNQISVSEFPTISRVYENTVKTEGYRMSEPERFNPSK